MKVIMKKYHQIMPWKMQIRCMKGQGGFASSMDASIITQLNGYFTIIWTTNTIFTWR
jgi:hypothetical protein